MPPADPSGEQQGALECEQLPLLVEPAAVAAEAVARQHPVTRADDGDRVRRTGLPGRPHGARAARRGRQLAIGDRHAVRDAHHRLATRTVEPAREDPVELDVELLELAREVAAELVAHVGERVVVLDDLGPESRAQVVGHAPGRLSGERQAEQPRGPARERQDPDRRLHGGHRDHARQAMPSCCGLPCGHWERGLGPRIRSRCRPSRATRSGRRA